MKILINLSSIVLNLIKKVVLVEINKIIYFHRACLFALRDIQAGEELSYNYSGCLKEKTGGEQDEVHMLDGGGNGGGSSETFEGGNQQVLRAERTAGSPSKELSGKPCHCGAEGCKVYLPKGL